MFKSSISQKDFLSARGKPVKLFQHNISTSDGKPVSCRCTLKYISENWNNLSYIFIGLLPWVLILPIYVGWEMEDKTKPALVTLSIILLTLYLHFVTITAEELMVVKDLGIQMTRTYFTGRRVIEFFPVTSVNDVVLKQAVRLHQVVNFISVQIQTSKEKLFYKPIILPNANVEALKIIYKDIQNVLLP